MADLDMAKGRGIAKDLISGDGDKEVEARVFRKEARKGFIAEHRMINRDLVFHFFRPEEADNRYWFKVFPAVMDPVAQKHFAAGQDRLSAEYIKDYELDSWYLIARGYDHVLDADAFVDKFYRALEAGLTSNVT